jgi:monoamine oxidase
MRMTSIARNGDGTYALAFDGHPSITADLVILSLPFAVLRKIDTSGAGFDARKNTAIQELGRGLALLARAGPLAGARQRPVLYG